MVNEKYKWKKREKKFSIKYIIRILHFSSIWSFLYLIKILNYC